MPTQELATYKRTQVETASPLQLVVMLYDGAIANVNAAKKAIIEGDVESKSRAVDRSLAIIGELQGTLDFDQGGEIAQQLNGLYTYFCEQIVEASVRLDPAPLDHVLGLVETVRSAWQEIALRPSAAAAPPPGPPESRESRLSLRT